MEDPALTNQNATAKCPVCRIKVNAEDVFCNNCCYPRKGTEREQRLFLLKRNTQKSKLARANKKNLAGNQHLIYRGRPHRRYWPLGNCFLSFTALRGDYGQLICQLPVAITFVALGFWCKKRPLSRCTVWFFVLFTFADIVCGYKSSDNY